MVEALDPTNTILENNQPDSPDPQPDNTVQEFISGWLDKIAGAKTYHKDSFEKMDECTLLANGIHRSDQTKNDDRYIADIIGRIVARRVAALYAKNPTVVAKRTKRLDFSVWDGNNQSLEMAKADPANPYNAAVIQDYYLGAQHRDQLDRVAKTLEIVYNHEIKQQAPKFKRQMKKLINQVEVTDVGYVRLDYHRKMDIKPDMQQRINDYAAQLSELEATVAVMEEDGSPTDGEMEALRAQMAGLEQNKYTLVSEGILLSFPGSKSLIIDKNCTNLDTFENARFVAEEFFMSNHEIQRLYDKQIGSATTYVEDRSIHSGGNGNKYKQDFKWKEGTDPSGNAHYCVYLVYDLDTKTTFTIAIGYNDYLSEPEAPTLMLERFYPYYALTFNQTKNPVSIYGDSTVWTLRHQQKEFDRAKEALRQHRIASRPLYASGPGALSKDDKKGIDEHGAHDVLELENLGDGKKADDAFSMVKKHPIDPNVYNTNDTLKDMYLIAGSQPADLSQVSGATATESSLAEDSRVSDMASNADDLDDFLTEIAEDMGKIIMTEFSPETVKRIAGPGSLWPEFSDQDLADDIYLEIQAGSSGRPNKAAEAAAIRSAMPFVVQLPGASPEFWAKKITEATFDNIDLEDAYSHGAPSILAMNQAAQVSTGDPRTDPNAQGVQGGANSPTDRSEPVKGLDVGGMAQAAMNKATAVGDNPERRGGMGG